MIGLAISAFLFVNAWAALGPFIALGYLLFGQFLAAAVFMAASLFAESHAWSNFYVGWPEYVVLLSFGFALEVIKHTVKYWWQERQKKPGRLPYDLVINIVDDGEVDAGMKDITPRRRRDELPHFLRQE
jgi:hypothetical protein